MPDYAAAIQAYGEALAAAPHDPQAQAERGYAEHLAGKDDDAVADLEQAARAAPSRRLAAQIWFNLGLTREAKAPDEALVDFAHAYALIPSVAAKKKIHGRSVCPLNADTKRVAALPAKSWVDVASVLSAPDAGVAVSMPALSRPLAGESDAQVTLKVDASKPDLTLGADAFYVVQTGDAMLAAAKHVVQRSGAQLWVYPNMGLGMGGRCAFVDDVTVEKMGSFAHVARKDDSMSPTYSCTFDTGDAVWPCDGTPGEKTVGTACLSNGATFRDAFIDPAAHAIVLSLEDTQSCAFSMMCDTRQITLRADGAGIHASGLGCDKTFFRATGGP